VPKQTPPSAKPDPRTNHFLARLEREDYDELMRQAKIVPVKLGKRMIRQDEPVDSVYFPIDCMFSLLVTNDGQPQMEMATIGREGMVGGSEALHKQGSIGLSLVQIPGSTVRIDANAFRQIISSRMAVQRLIHQHVYALLRQVLYGAACNRIHSMEERCARWLLMTHDRAGQDTFPLTQQFLSHMLGVRRATVNVATGMLKKAGFIRYVRGKLTITDRPGLESASCDCYHAIVRVYESLRPDAPKQAS
jgi:CRP-like cAMP-binding protein